MAGVQESEPKTNTADDTLSSEPKRLPSSSDDSLPQAFIPNREDEEKGEVGSNLSRIESNPSFNRELSKRLTNSDVDSYRKRLEKTPLPPMGNGRPYPPPVPERSQYAVGFDGPDDPLHPHNWSWKKRIIQGAIIAYQSLCLTFCSSIYSSGTQFMAAHFHVAPVVITLGVSLYVLGFASGPVIWAPLSELYGRKPLFLFSAVGFTLFQFGAATAENLQTLLLCRFFGGFVGASPLAVVPASFADMFGNNARGAAIVVFAMVVFIGPLVGPIVGSFISFSYLGWRWTEYISGIMGGLSIILTCFFQETHHPIILTNKAIELRKRTGNWGIHSPHEEFEVSLREIAEKNVTRPIKMLFTEPIILFITIYNSFIYGLLYLFLTAYPIVFAEGYRMHGGVAELPYLGMVVGMLIGGVFCVYLEKYYNRQMAKNDGKPVPEARLPAMIVGGFIFPMGLFWFTWSGAYPDTVHWAVPMVSGLFTGFGLLSIFIPSLNYIVDAYLFFAASAIAANTVMRSSFGAAFPLFAAFMFHGMGTNWAGLVLGLVAVALIPVPLVLLFYGKRIRGKSKFAFVL